MSIKPKKDRLVPLHTDLASALDTALGLWWGGKTDPLIRASRQSAWGWYKKSLATCNELDLITPGRKCGTHTLRHSAARHWVLNGVPINVVSRWLGHAGLQQTMVYLELVSDPGGFMERVP